MVTVSTDKIADLCLIRNSVLQLDWRSAYGTLHSKILRDIVLTQRCFFYPQFGAPQRAVLGTRPDGVPPAALQPLDLRRPQHVELPRHRVSSLSVRARQGRATFERERG